MGFREMQAALELHVQSNLSVAALVFENTPAPNPDQFNEWARVVVQFGDSSRITLGQNTRSYRHPGLLMLQIFTREGEGIDRGVQLADSVVTALRDQVVGGINLQVPKINKVPFADKGWTQLQVATPFYFDEVI